MHLTRNNRDHALITGRLGPLSCRSIRDLQRNWIYCKSNGLL